ncbi:hypothetical protein ACFX19_031670 [Malus domestica]
MVDGFGKIDGQGSAGDNDNCKPQKALEFNNCLNLSGLPFLNSPQAHIAFEIHLSEQATIVLQSTAGAPFSILPTFACGPGHGISVGSLGADGATEKVDNIYVKDCSFTRTINGARIKTWQGGSGTAKVSRRHGGMRRTSISKGHQPQKVIQFDCDKISGGCYNIVMDQIDIKYSVGDKMIFASCNNSEGTSIGTTVPNVLCLKSSGTKHATPTEPPAPTVPLPSPPPPVPTPVPIVPPPAPPVKPIKPLPSPPIVPIMPLLPPPPKPVIPPPLEPITPPPPEDIIPLPPDAISPLPSPPEPPTPPTPVPHAEGQLDIMEAPREGDESDIYNFNNNYFSYYFV